LNEKTANEIKVDKKILKATAMRETRIDY